MDIVQEDCPDGGDVGGINPVMDVVEEEVGVRSRSATPVVPVAPPSTTSMEGQGLGDLDLGVVKQEVEAEEPSSECPALSMKDDVVKKELDDHFLDAVKLEKLDLEPPYVIVNRKDNILLAVNR